MIAYNLIRRKISSLPCLPRLRSFNDQLDRRYLVSAHAVNALLDPILTILDDETHEVDSLLDPFQTLPVDNQRRGHDLIDPLSQGLGQISAKGGTRRIKPTVGERFEILGRWLLDGHSVGHIV